MEVVVHPVALFNITDYLARAEAAPDAVTTDQLLGGLLGIVDVDTNQASIMYSFEIPHDHGIEQLVKRLGLYKTVYKYLKFIGFYTIGNQAESIKSYCQELAQVNIPDLVNQTALLQMDINGSLSLTAANQASVDNSNKTHLPFNITILCSSDKTVDYVKDTTIKALNIERVALNSIAQATQEVEHITDPFQDFARDTSSSLQILDEKTELLLQKLNDITLGKSRYSPEENSMLLQSIGDLVVKLEMVKQSKNNKEDDTLQLQLVNQALLLDNLTKISAVNKQCARSTLTK